jgi:hypothetical protein
MPADRKLFARLPRRQRNSARSIARDLLFELQCDGQPFDLDRAEELARERCRSVIGSILIAVAVRLIIELIKYWLANRISEPSAIYELGEPGNFELNEEDHAD